VIGMNACASKLNHLGANRFIRREVELTLAVIADVYGGTPSRLQTIRTNNLTRFGMFDDQVVADCVERIDIEPVEMRLHQAFIQFEIKNPKP
jgi:hypothetical protein